jgi:hypothetical protein
LFTALVFELLKEMFKIVIGFLTKTTKTKILKPKKLNNNKKRGK